MNDIRRSASMVIGIVISVLSSQFCYAATGDPVLINEVYASHTGTDDSEYIELYGIPGTSLDGLSLIVVESDTGASNGSIDRSIEFAAEHVIGSNGFYLIGNPLGLASHYNITPNIDIPNNYLENSSQTIALVESASIVGNTVNGSEIVLDAIALNDGGIGDSFFFNAPVIGPDGTFFPAGARRVFDGVDTDSTEDWLISDFALGPDNTPTSGDAPPPPPPEPLSIMQIQGPNQNTAYDNVRVETSGIVTLFTSNGANFWMQDPTGDDDVLTSDGLFVAGGGFPDQGNRPVVGDKIRIVARVDSLQFGKALPLTRLTNVETIEVISSNNSLPTPVSLKKLPDMNITDGISFWEPLEGMLVSIKDATVVAPTTRFGEFVIVAKGNQKPGSGFFHKNDHLLISSTGEQQVDYNPERIMIDDSSLSHQIITKPGDEIESLTGVLDYTFGNYKIQPLEYKIEHHTKDEDTDNNNDKTEKNILSVASFNVENLFDLTNDPGKNDSSSTPTPDELEIKLTKLALAITNKLNMADIIVMQEVENTSILQTLADRVNAQSAAHYRVASFETSDARGIEVGFMWNANRVISLGEFQMTGADVDVAFGPGSASPGREPLVGTFVFNDTEVTIIGNHFKSKGEDEPLFGINQPANRISEIQRKLQAQAVRNFVNQLLANNADANIIVTGDLNDFQFAEPGEGLDHPVGILEGIGDEIPLSNLINDVHPSQRYTYIFDGNSQVLDHMLVSPHLLDKVKSVDIRHFNASYPYNIADDATVAHRVSDHDPILVRFKLKHKKHHD